MADLRALAEKIGPEEWKLNTGIGVGDDAKKDVDRLGWFVFRPHWGAVAVTPKDSPQFSRHGTLMEYIAAADPKAVLGLFEEIEQLREGVLEIRRRLVEMPGVTCGMDDVIDHALGSNPNPGPADA